MEDFFQIAIDGPGGAGKSTVAKKVAAELGIEYIDTGAMYRAFGLKLLREKMPIEDKPALRSLLENTHIDFRNGAVTLDGEDVSGLIRTPGSFHGSFCMLCHRFCKREDGAVTAADGQEQKRHHGRQGYMRSGISQCPIQIFYNRIP